MIIFGRGGLIGKGVGLVPVLLLSRVRIPHLTRPSSHRTFGVKRLGEIQGSPGTKIPLQQSSPVLMQGSGPTSMMGGSVSSVLNPMASVFQPGGYPSWGSQSTHHYPMQNLNMMPPFLITGYLAFPPIMYQCSISPAYTIPSVL